MANSFDLSVNVRNANPSANIDFYYGTYNSVADALAGVPKAVRMVGKTVGVVVNGSVVEYWWKSGVEDADLVKKIDDVVLKQNLKVSIELGGITTKPTYNAGTSIENILRDLLSPYVAFDYSVVGTASSGTFEYGTTKTISKFNISITEGTIAPTSLSIGTTLDDDDLKSVSNPVSGDVELDSSITLDGTENNTYYFKMSDDTSDVRKTLSYNFVKYIYYGVVSTNTKPTSGVGLSSAQSVSNGVSLTTTSGSYIVFLTPTEMVNKQILQEAEQNVYVPLASTTNAGSVIFTTNTGQSLTYYVYFSPEMGEGTGKFKIN